jgi:hypothetical protein
MATVLLLVAPGHERFCEYVATMIIVSQIAADILFVKVSSIGPADAPGGSDYPASFKE